MSACRRGDAVAKPLAKEGQSLTGDWPFLVYDANDRRTARSLDKFLRDNGFLSTPLGGFVIDGLITPQEFAACLLVRDAWADVLAGLHLEDELWVKVLSRYQEAVATSVGEDAGLRNMWQALVVHDVWPFFIHAEEHDPSRRFWLKNFSQAFARCQAHFDGVTS